jgi:hypothetical protein
MTTTTRTRSTFALQTLDTLAGPWTTQVTFRTRQAARRAFDRLVAREPFYAVQVVDAATGARWLFFGGR